MREQVIKNYYKCDFCGKEVDENGFVTSPWEGCSVVYHITQDVWYGGEYELDICEECHDKLKKFIDEELRKDNF